MELHRRVGLSLPLPVGRLLSSPDHWLNSLAPPYASPPFAAVLTFCSFVPDILFVLVILCPLTSLPDILAELSEGQSRVVGSNYHVCSVL